MYIRWVVPLPGIPARSPTELRFFAVSQTFTVAHVVFFGTALASALDTSSATEASRTAKGTQRIPPDPRDGPAQARHPAYHPPMPEGGDTAELLASVKVFSGLEPRELEEVARVAVPRSFDRGEVVFREGDPGDTCYVVRSGTVSIRRDHPDGRSRALAELRNGAIFGELSMFGAETRSATAEVLEPTQLVAILRADMQRVIRSSPDIAFKMLAELADRVRLVNEQLSRQSFQTVSGRVASTLLAQVVTRQSEGAGEHDVLVKATQAEIAQLAGTSRESASRFLATLAREGVVTLGRGRVTVHDPDRLRGFIH